MAAVWPTEPVEASGVVALWGGWSLGLPGPCMTARNDDGSWSAWDAARTVDVHIIETAGHQSGRTFTAEEMLGEPATESGDGWIGVISLFQESDDAISFIGRSLFRGSVQLPVDVPIGRYTTQVFLFRNGKLLSQSQSSLQVEKVGAERMIYTLAFHYPFAYGLLAVLMAVSAGLLAWTVFRRE